MSSADGQRYRAGTGSEQPRETIQGISCFSFPGSIFLMINSLQTGGTERQFAEIARSLRKIRWGQILFKYTWVVCKEKGRSLKASANCIMSELGGSLYGLHVDSKPLAVDAAFAGIGDRGRARLRFLRESDADSSREAGREFRW